MSFLKRDKKSSVKCGANNMVKLLIYLQSRVYYAVCAILLFIMLIIPFTGPQSSIHGDFGDMARLPGYYSLIMMFNSGDWNIYISPNSELVNVWKVKFYGIVVGLLVMGLWILILASPVICHVKKQKSLFIYIILALFSHLIWLLAEWADGVNSHVWLAPGEYLIIIPSFLFLAGFCSSYLMQETNSVKKHVAALEHTISSLPKQKLLRLSTCARWLIITGFQLALVPFVLDIFIHSSFGLMSNYVLVILYIVSSLLFCYFLYIKHFSFSFNMSRQCSRCLSLRSRRSKLLCFNVCWLIIANIRLVFFFCPILAGICFLYGIKDLWFCTFVPFSSIDSLSVLDIYFIFCSLLGVCGFCLLTVIRHPNMVRLFF